ncbi:MAG: hypothetical protein ACLRMJ_09945 [Alistipes finegoldii]
MVRPLLYQQLCDPPLHGQLQPQVGHCRRLSAAQIANHNSYKNLQYLAGNAIGRTRQTYEGWSQTNRLSFQARRFAVLRRPQSHAMAGYDFLKRKINGMSMTVQAPIRQDPDAGAAPPTAWITPRRRGARSPISDV